MSRSDNLIGHTNEVTASDKTASDEFGFSVSISADGNTCAVGSYLAAGTVYIFTKSSNI